MWKKSFIFLLALVLVVSSLSAHPSWLYGRKAKAETAETLPVPAEPLTSVEPVALDQPSTPEETQSSEGQKEPGESLRSYLKGLNLAETEVEAICSYLDLIDAGVKTMTEAYEAEVAHGKETEAKYNELVDSGVKLPKTKVEGFVSPSVLYSIKTQTFGASVNLGITYGRYGLIAGVTKPAIPTLGSLKDISDLMVSAGFVFKF